MPHKQHDTASRATFCPQAVARSTLLQDMIPFILVDRYQHFWEACYIILQGSRQQVCLQYLYISASLHNDCDHIHCNMNLTSLHSIHLQVQLCDFVTGTRRWLAQSLQQWLRYGLDDMRFERRQGHDIPHSCHVLTRGVEQ